MKKRVRLTALVYRPDENRAAVIVENYYPAPLYLSLMEVLADKELLYQLPGEDIEQICAIGHRITEEARRQEQENLRNSQAAVEARRNKKRGRQCLKERLSSRGLTAGSTCRE